MKKAAVLLSIIGVVSFVAGCSDKKDPEPKVETSVNVDLDKTREKMGNALDKAGEEIKKGANVAAEKIENAGDALKKNVNEATQKLTDDKKAEVKVEVNK